MRQSLGDQAPNRHPLKVMMLAAADYEVDARIRRQAESLVRRGDSVTVVALGERHGGMQIKWLEGVQVIEVPVSKYRGESVRAYIGVYCRFALWAALQASKRPTYYDLIQIHSMPEALVLCALVPKMFGVPVLLDVHDLSSQLFATKFSRSRWVSLIRASERQAFRFASSVMTVHLRYAEMIREMGAGSSRDIDVVLNSPDETRWANYRWRSWTNDQVLYSFHGTLVHRHGVLLLLEAFAMVRRVLPGSRLQILGDGDARDDVLRAISRLDLRDSVTISPGPVPVDDMPSSIDRAHIGLAPNLLDGFTRSILPTKVLEYVALGIPVIASELPTLKDYFTGSEILYVRPGDVEDLAQAMVLTARSPEEARLRSERASVRLSEFGWALQQEAYYGVIDRLVTHGRRASNQIPSENMKGWEDD